MSGAVFVGFVWLFVGIVGTLWVFIDASENSSQSAVLWGLVAFLGGILGILLYVLLGRDGGSERSRTRTEPARGTAKISHRCQSCGEKYYAPDSEISSCRNCGGIKVERLG
ncbi:hypothetical protein [Natrinema amylolyticum]|uniref:hypothetical protein n=1 Tax=Natrinema amylolyticum TaxID=2878679 RepID=UPI001CF930FA|nr:hypothetical protein [Natrinema amylolyticum]